MAFRAVWKSLLIVVMTLAAGLFDAARGADPVDDVEKGATALGGRVLYGDDDVGHAIVEVQLTGKNVTPESLGSLVKPLSELPHLRRLVIISNEIQDDDLRLLAGIPHLKDLQLNCRLTGAGVAHLAPLRELTGLGFFCSQELTDTALIQMKAMTQLKQVRLVATPRVTETGLKLLRDLPALEELTLRYTGVSAEGLDVLKDFPALRKVALAGGRGIDFSTERIRELRAALPECEFVK
jgi:hypothetical protein